MADNPRVFGLLEELLNSGKTPDEVCRDCPELLAEVRQRWQQFCRIDAKVGMLLPEKTFVPDAGPTASAASNADLPQAPGYDVESVLGRGGMGVVFKARQLKLNRTIALKMLLAGAYAGPEELARFQREAEAVAALRHPNIVQIHDAGELTGRPYFTMEYVEGGSLADSLGGKPQPPRRAAELVATLAAAIQFAHKSGFIHRDLKPGNVLLSADGMPKITDFGLARSIHAGRQFTMSGDLIGTPSYMAPEQAMGNASAIGPAVDIYALGAVLYELLTGRPPFVGQSAVETMQKVLAEEPVPPSRLNAKVPRDLETICLKCLQKNPSRRYASAQDLADDLHRYLDGHPVLARPVGMGERALKWARRRPTLATLLVMLTAVLSISPWLLQQENTRRTSARQAIETGIEQAYASAKSEHFQPAELSLADAESHLANAHSGELTERLARAKTDVQLARDLVDAWETTETGFSVNSAVPHEERYESLITMYNEACGRAGLDLDADATVTAGQIGSSRLCDITVIALDRWALAAFMLKRKAEQRKLLKIAGLVDRAAARGDRFRDPGVWDNVDLLRKLADDAFSPGLPPPPTHQLIITATLLRRVGARIKSLGLLHEASRRHPTSSWVYKELAQSYYNDRKYKDSVSFHRPLVALRPNQPGPTNELGLALVMAGELDEGISCIRLAVELEKNKARRRDLRRNLVHTLNRAGRTDEALAEAKHLFKADPEDAQSADILGFALFEAKRYEDAIAMFRKAVALDPKFASAQYRVGAMLRFTGRPAEAIEEFKKTLVIDERNLDGHFGLSMALYDLGRHQEAALEFEWFLREYDRRKNRIYGDQREHFELEHAAARQRYAESLYFLGRFAKAHDAAVAYLELPSATPAVRSSLRRQLALCKELRVLESRLPEILAGTPFTGPAAMVWGLAEWCFKCKRLPATSVRLYEQVFKQQASLANDLDGKHRFHAACAAALAACGDGGDAAKLDDKARAAFRKKALDWLCSDRDAWIGRRNNARQSELPWETVRPWLQCKELAGVRDEAALAKLSAEERQQWQNLWADVKTLAGHDAGPLLVQARSYVDRREWAKAADAYAQIKHAVQSNSEAWFEYAAVQLLAGDRDGYRKTCKQMLADKTMRAFLAARACTLAADSVADVVLASKRAAVELKNYETAFWSLTERGAINVRTNSAKSAIGLFRSSLDAEKRPGAAVVNVLWLALAYHQLGNTTEAREQLKNASNFLNGVGRERPADAELTKGLHRHNWLEAHVLRREAESLLQK